MPGGSGRKLLLILQNLGPKTPRLLLMLQDFAMLMDFAATLKPRGPLKLQIKNLLGERYVGARDPPSEEGPAGGAHIAPVVTVSPCLGSAHLHAD